MLVRTSCFALAVGLGHIAQAQLDESRTIAKTGDTAPGTGGETFASFGEPLGSPLPPETVTRGYPTINNSDSIAFGAVLDDTSPTVNAGNDEGIWAQLGDTLTLIAREGDLIPGSSTLTFQSLDPPIIGGNNTLLFYAEIETAPGSGLGPESVWAYLNGTLVLLAQNGMSIPGRTGEDFVGINRNSICHVSGDGDVLVELQSRVEVGSQFWIYTELWSTKNRTNFSFDLRFGILRTSSDPEFSRRGSNYDPAQNAFLRGLRSFPRLSDRGDIYMNCQLDSTDASIITSGQARTDSAVAVRVVLPVLAVTELARRGQPSVVPPLLYTSGSGSGIDLSGSAGAFSSDGNSMLDVGLAGDFALLEGPFPSLIARSLTNVVPDENGNDDTSRGFNTFESYAIDNSSNAAFVALWYGTVTPDSGFGIWVSDGLTVRRAMLTGDPVPGMSGQTFDTNGLFSGNPNILGGFGDRAVEISQQEGVVFVDTISPSDLIGLWKYDFDSRAISSVITEGSSINLENDPTLPPDPQVVSGIGFGRTESRIATSPVSRSYNDNDALVVLLEFMNGTSAIVASPETVITNPCVADVNGDGVLSPADFNAWIIAYNLNNVMCMEPNCSPCDQNNDGLCTPADFNAWIVNFNAGCLPPGP